MVVTINPFDSGGYSLAEMTEAINILPNVYTRLGQMGLFRFDGITQRSAIIEQAEGVLNLLPTVPLGGPATVANRETRSMRLAGDQSHDLGQGDGKKLRCAVYITRSQVTSTVH